MSDPAFWDGIAERYAAKPVEDPDAFERKIEVTTSLATPADVVLDVGCGTGSLALRLAPALAHIHGLDLSGEMVRIARDRAAAQGLDNATFHVGAFDDGFTTFEAGSLDGVCAYSLLHLVEDRAATLARVHRLLAPGGFFVSSTVCLAESRVPLSPLLKVMKWFGKAPRVEVFSKETLEQDIRRAGFVGVTQQDVGAKRKTIAFIVARKPGTPDRGSSLGPGDPDGIGAR